MVSMYRDKGLRRRIEVERRDPKTDELLPPLIVERTLTSVVVYRKHGSDRTWMTLTEAHRLVDALTKAVEG